MPSIFSFDLLVMLVVGTSVFFISYLWADKVIAFIVGKSVGTRDQVVKTLDLMLVEFDKRKVNLALYLVSFGLGAVMFLVFWPSLISGFLFGAIMTYVGWILPKVIITNAWESRCNRIVNDMVDGMTIMSNGIRAGLSITQTMERVVTNMGGPLSKEFNLILNKVRLGMTVEEALNEFGDRIPRQDVQMFVTSVNILKETGGNLAETFNTITMTVRERQKIEKKIQALTAQGSMQAIIITLVPFILLVVFMVIDPNYIKPVLTTPLGWFFLALMVGLQVIGGVMMKKIVTIKV